MLILNRTRTDKRGTLGILSGPDCPFTLFTLEEPWLNNASRVSCIPAGTYVCRPHAWGEDKAKFHFKEVWEVTKVPNRTAILIHAGNTLKDTQGCILVGKILAGFSVRESQSALHLLRRYIGQHSFTLQIVDAFSTPKTK